MFSSFNLFSFLIGVAIAMIVFNLFAMFKAYLKMSASRKKLADAKKRMGEIDKELREKQKQIEDALKKFSK